MKTIVVWLMTAAMLWAAEIPSWFLQRSYQPAKSYEVIGYGMGKTLKEASLHAKEDIAGQLMTEISSTKKSRLHSGDDDLVRSLDIEIDTQGHTVLSDLTPVKTEKIGEHFFVALKYENLKLSQRLVRKAENIVCLRRPLNPYLAATPMYREIKKAAGCDIDVSLVRKDRAWFIVYGTVLLPIAPVDYKDLFISVKHSPVTLSVSTSPLTEGDRFFFTVKTSVRGYVTLLDVYANGMTAVVEPSFRMKSGEIRRLPSPEADSDYEAALLEEGVPTYDLYVVLFSPSPIDVSRFETAGDTLLSDEDAYMADRLMRLTATYPFTTLFVRTKPRAQP